MDVLSIDTFINEDNAKDIQRHKMHVEGHNGGGLTMLSHKDVWWRMLYTLFTITAVGYLMARRKENRKFHLIKPFPVLILGYVVLLWCSVHHQSNFVSSIFHAIVPNQPSSYSVYISIGLFLSAIGDLLLIFDKWFVHGILFFLVAHLSFILAFTADHASLLHFFTPSIVVLLVSVNIFFVYMFITKIIPLFMNNTPRAVIVALFFYLGVIVTMCYTASVKAMSKVVLEYDLWNKNGGSALEFFTSSSSVVLYSVLGAVGAVLFFLSDIMILIRAINNLKNNQVSTVRKLLGNGDVGMITYWLGQFCIALSVTASTI